MCNKGQRSHRRRKGHFAGRFTLHSCAGGRQELFIELSYAAPQRAQTQTQGGLLGATRGRPAQESCGSAGPESTVHRGAHVRTLALCLEHPAQHLLPLCTYSIIQEVEA
jgi:hypothetical protein